MIIQIIKEWIDNFRIRLNKIIKSFNETDYQKRYFGFPSTEVIFFVDLLKSEISLVIFLLFFLADSIKKMNLKCCSDTSNFWDQFWV